MKKDYKNILLLLLISIIAFWQVICLRNCLKWDFVDISMPWRFFIGENIRNGFLPLWVPYAKLGFPLYFDPQTWYPVSWLISLTFGYNVFTIQAEYVFHVFLAGVGMYYFIRHFTEDKTVRLSAGVIFMLSGFFVGNAQHLGWIVSGTWIPFVLNSYLNIYKKKTLLSVLSLPFFLFLLFTGGYFPFFITTIYIIIGIFVYKMFVFFRNGENEKVKTAVINHIISVLIFCAISLVVFLSLLETQEFIARGNGITIEKALNNPLEIITFLTFIFPFSTMWGSSDFWGADKTVINSYFGLLPFLILFFALFIKKTKKENLLLLSGILAYIIALANVFPVRRILYYILPFFNYFRFPSLFRYFGIFAFTIFSLLILKRILENKKLFRYFRLYLLSVYLIMFLMVSYSFFTINIHFDINNWYEYIKNISFKETVFIQGLFHILILSGIITILFYKKIKKHKLFYIISVVIFDMLIATQLNAPKTVYSPADAVLLQKNLNKLPEGFPIPDINEKLTDINKKCRGIYPLWRNMGFYYKKISYKGYGPYQLDNFTKLEQSGLFPDLLKNPVLYFAEYFYPVSGKSDTVFIKKHSAGMVLTDNSDILTGRLKKNIGDKIIITSFTPKSIDAKVRCKEDNFLVFMQNYKNDWNAYVDGKEVKIFLINYSLQGIKISAGSHHIRFSFENKMITYAFYFSSLSFIFLLISVIIVLFNNIKNNH